MVWLSMGLPEWLIWYQVSAVFVCIFAIVFYVYWKKVRIYYEMEFWRKTSFGDFERVGAKEFKKSDKEVSFKGRTFFVSMVHSLGRTKNKTLLAVDFDTADYLRFGGRYYGGDCDHQDNLLANGVFARIVRGYNGLDAYMLIIIVLMAVGMVLMFFVGLFASDFIFPDVSSVVGG